MIFVALIVVAVQAGPPTTQADAMLVSILVALLTGGCGSAAFNFYRHKKFGPQERDSLIADASEKAVESLKTALEQYQRDLEDAKKAIVDLQEKLESADKRIAQLEHDLAKAEGDRDRLQKELSAALERRAGMAHEMTRLQERIGQLEDLLGTDEHGGPRRE